MEYLQLARIFVFCFIVYGAILSGFAIYCTVTIEDVCSKLDRLCDKEKK